MSPTGRVYDLVVAEDTAFLILNFRVSYERQVDCRELS